MFHAQGEPRHELKLTRIIPASPEEVFEAWTTAESMKQWFCPEGSTVLSIELDVRVGGSFRIDVQHADAGKMVINGVYREVAPPERLAFTWISTHTRFRESLVTLNFLARGEATELILFQTQLPDEETVQWHVAGWTELLDLLVAVWSTKNP